MSPASESAFQDTHSLFHLSPSIHRDDPSYTQWDQRGKGTCPRLHSKLLAVSQGFHSEASVLLPCAEKQGSRKVALEEGQRPHGPSQNSDDVPVLGPEDSQHWMSSHQVLASGRWGRGRGERRGRAAGFWLLNAPRSTSFSSSTSILGMILHPLTTISPAHTHEFPNPRTPFSHTQVTKPAGDWHPPIMG